MATLNIFCAGAGQAVVSQLAAKFQRETGNLMHGEYGAVGAMKARVVSGAPADIVIVTSALIDELIAEGEVIASTRADLGRVGTGVAVRAGAPKPDISSGEALKRAVLAAKSVVYSTGPSGIYLKDLFERWGIAAQIASKLVVVKGEPAGAVCARGEAELAFQQVCELLPVPGIDLAGWQWIFFLNVPAALLVGVLLYVVAGGVETPRAPGGLDLGGAALASAALLAGEIGRAHV